MLAGIKKFFEQHLAEQAPEDHEHRLRLATAALLIEVMNVDDHNHDLEHDTLISTLQSRFGLSNNETQQLVNLAHEENHLATDYHQFTSLINAQFSQDEKVQLVEHLWQIAYADGRLDKYEEHLIRKIADLLYLSHEAYITAKHRAQSN